MRIVSNVEKAVNVTDVEWLAEGEIPKAAVTLLSGEPGSGKSFVACLTPGSRRSLERADRQTAGQWLFEALRDQDVPSRMLYAQARQCGFSRNAILRAAHRMGLHSHKSAFDGCWKYSLRDVPREILDAYQTHPKWFSQGDRGQGTGNREGFRVQVGDGIAGQGSGVGEHEGARARQCEAATDVENAENRSKSPKREEVGGQGSGTTEGTGRRGQRTGKHSGFRIRHSACRKSRQASKNPKSPKTREYLTTSHSRGVGGQEAGVREAFAIQDSAFGVYHQGHRQKP